ncbi:hypothetical protein GBA52_028749 [Prunus armeniaca]|nr:hypothetical protein GBA52_028749 [Prunus armeniaca]
MRVVFYHGVGSQVFMDSFFGVDPKAIMSQNEEAIEKLFLFLCLELREELHSLSPRYEQKVVVLYTASCTPLRSTNPC